MIGKKINQLATELAPVSTDLTIIGDPDSGVSKKITLAQLGAIFSGAVSFYTNLAGFPVVGDINVIYCAKDTQKLYLWSGSAYVEVFPSQALLNTYQLRSEKGVSNGYASLDSGGKVPISQLPSSIMEYKGTWNASTNTPTLANGTGDTGDVYICNVAGTVNFGAGPITFAVGDYVIYSGTIWQRSSGAVGTVTSVAVSRSGDALTITGSPITTSGTINIGFAGANTQYVRGDGTLATFPSIISQAQNLVTEVYNKTGATLTKGTVVYINGGQGNLPTITKALATGDSTSAQTYGIVQNDITNNNNGYVVVAGRLSDLDTQAFTEGTQLYLSATTAGTYTSTKQYAPNHLVYVGIVVRAHPTQGVIEVKIQNGYEMDELHNVAAQTPTNNDGLFWEASTSLWKNKSIATVLGYTPQAQLNGTGFVKASGTTITYDNSTYLTTSAASTTYLPMVLSSTANFVDINGQQFSIYGSAGGFTSGRIIVDPLFSALGYQNTGVFNGLKILTNGNAEFTNSGITRFFNQVRFDSTLTDGTYTYTLPGATGTIALVGGAGVGTVTSVGLSSATSGVTIGSTPITTSGTITLAIATASGSQQGLLSSTDWTTFNNKQAALTNPVTGTGTTNYLPKFTGTSTIGNSIIFDNGTNVGIGTTSPNDKLSVVGNVNIGNNYTASYPLDVNSTSDFNIRIRKQALGGTVGILFETANDFSGTSQAWIRGTGAGSNGTSFLTFGTATNTGDTTASEKMRITSAGNVGIGTTSPQTTLSVETSGTQNVISPIITAQGSGVTYTGMYSIRDGAGDQRGLLFQVYTSNVGLNEKMRITSAGNVGIGLTNPDAKLFVKGSGGAQLLIDYQGAPTNYYDADTHIFRSYSGNTYPERMRISSGGNVGIGTTSPGQILTIDKGASTAYIQLIGQSRNLYLGQDSTGASIYSDGAAPMYFSTAGSERMRITSAGNVGIGTTSPTARLDLGNNVGSANTANQIALYSLSGTALYGFGVSAAQLNYISGGNHSFYNSATTSVQMTITSAGNVGIGTTSPSARLSLGTGTTSKLLVYDGGTIAQGGNGFFAGFAIDYPNGNDFGMYAHNNGSIVFGKYTNNNDLNNVTERMRITSGGNVGIGTSSPNSLASTTNLIVRGTSGGSTALIQSLSADAGCSVALYSGASSSDDPAILFQKNLRFGSVTDVGLGSFSERMRIKSSGIINLSNVPSSSAGLSSGDIYKSAGVLMIV